MAPIAADNTPRTRFEYTVNGEQHDFQIRSNQSPTGEGSFVDTFLTALGPELYALTIGTVSHAVSGSSIFLPVTTGIEGNTYGSGAGVYEQKAWYVDFIGRSAGGRRWRLAVFGIRTLATDFRYVAGENANITAAIAALNGGAGLIPLGVDELSVTVYPYANAGVNAHWQRALRP